MAGRHSRIIFASWRAESKRRRAMTGKRKRGTEMEFLPEALEIVETPPSPFGRLILWVILLAFVLAICWAVWGRIDIVATAQGKVVPAGQVRTLEAPETGIVRAINVRNGDFVKQGDILLELDKTLASADSESVKNEVRQAETKAAIAQGIIRYVETGRIVFNPPPETPPHIVSVSRQQMESRIRAYDEERMVLVEDKYRAESSRESIDQEIAKLRSTLPLMKQRMQSYKQLSSEGLAPKIDALRLEEDVITRERDLDIAIGRRGEIIANMAAADRRVQLIKKQLRRDALTELAEAESIKADRAEAEKKTDARNSWQTLRAPVDGTVLALQVFTVGEVVEPGAPLLLISPQGEELIVEAMILNRDIGFVREGDEVSVKIEAFPFTRYGLVTGTLEHISADAIPDERVGLVYPARVTLSEPFVGEGEFRRALSSGMNATAEVKTGDRPIIDFILSPIAKVRKEAGRER